MDTQLITRFTRFAEEARQKYGVVCQLADIRGERWSYVAGLCPGEIPVSEPSRIQLGHGFGLVIYDIAGLNKETMDKVKSDALSFWGRLPVT